jgi:hypothetical protein
MKHAGVNQESSTVTRVERKVDMASTDKLPCRSPRIKVSRSFWKLFGEMLWADFNWYLQLWRTASCISIAASLRPSHADRIMHGDAIISVIGSTLVIVEDDS